MRRRLERLASHVVTGPSSTRTAARPSGSQTAAASTDGAARFAWRETVKPLENQAGWGVELSGLDLSRCSREEVLALGELAIEHGVVCVRNCTKTNVLHGVRQHEISCWLSPISEVFTGHQTHIEQEHPAVFRLSNDPEVGVPGAGGGWHHDSTHLDNIPPFAMYHLQQIPERGGATWFAFADPEELDVGEITAWSRLQGFHPGGTGVGLHPVVQPSADANPKPYLLPLGAGFTTHDERGAQIGKLTREESSAVLKRWSALLNSPETPPIRHAWAPGDVVLTDNRRVAHRGPHKSEQEEIIGTRILHRTIALGAAEDGAWTPGSVTDLKPALTRDRAELERAQQEDESVASRLSRCENASNPYVVCDV